MTLRIVGLVAFLISAIALIPLRQILPEDFSAATVNGTIWNGSVEGGRWQGFELGNFDLALHSGALLLGEARLGVSGPDLSGQVILGEGVEALSGRRMLVGLPVSSLQAQDLTLHFQNGQCTSASGTLWVTLPTGATTLSGTPRCVGNQATVALASADGLITSTLTLSATGQIGFAA